MLSEVSCGGMRIISLPKLISSNAPPRQKHLQGKHPPQTLVSSKGVNLPLIIIRELSNYKSEYKIEQWVTIAMGQLQHCNVAQKLNTCWNISWANSPPSRYASKTPTTISIRYCRLNVTTVVEKSFDTSQHVLPTGWQKKAYESKANHLSAQQKSRLQQVIEIISMRSYFRPFQLGGT